MSQCGSIPEFSLAPNSDLSAVDLNFTEKKVGPFMADLPSGASLNPAFIESISGQFTDYLQSPEIKEYASCRIGEATEDLDLNRLEEISDQGLRLMNSLAPSAINLSNKVTTLMDNADNFKGEFDTLKGRVEARSKEITLNSLNNIQSTVENYRTTISLVLTIVAFLVILIFINIMQRLIPKNPVVAALLIFMLIAIFIVTYLIFDSLYNNQILKPFIEKSDLIKKEFLSLSPSPSPSPNPNDESEENDWIWIWIYLGIDIFLIGFIILGLIIVNKFFP